MNIYALSGHKVRCVSLNNNHRLKLGEEYTVDCTSVSNWSTTVYLLEFPNTGFNSVLFEDVEKQYPEDDNKHPDYNRYNLRAR
jgi:hypothetical protein